MSALRCALGAVVPPLSPASPHAPARKMSPAEERRPPTTPRRPEGSGARRGREAPVRSARSARRELWSRRRCGRPVEAAKDSVSRRAAGCGRRGSGGKGGPAAGCCGRCWGRAVSGRQQEDAQSLLEQHQDGRAHWGPSHPERRHPFRVVLWSCHRNKPDKVGNVNVETGVEVLRSLVALTDPQEGKLTQSQEKALNLLDIWKTAFRVVPGPTKTSVE